MKKLTKEEKYNNTVKLLGKEVADIIKAKSDYYDKLVIEKFGRLYKYEVKSLQTNESIRLGLSEGMVRLVTCKGDIDIYNN